MTRKPDSDDVAYFRRRAQEERDAAAAALDPGAAHAHLQLARYYDLQAKRHEEHDPDARA